MITDPDILIHLREASEWKGVRSIVKVYSRRQFGAEITENEPHYVLEIAFREDESYIGKDHG